MNASTNKIPALALRLTSCVILLALLPSCNATQSAVDTYVTVDGSDPADAMPVNFGSVGVAGSATRTVVIANPDWATGKLACGVSITGTDFSIISGEGPFYLLPGQYETVTLRFAPTAAATRAGTLSISHNASSVHINPISVSVSGTGVAVSVTPAAPLLSLPANGDTGISINPILSWDPVAGAASYNLQVSVSPAFISTVHDQSGITATSRQITGASLTGGTTYYWRVNAANSAGSASLYSDAWSFKTTTPVSGTQWTVRTSGTTATLRSVTWGDPLSGGETGLFVAVGMSGTILTSPDGITWSPRSSGTTVPLYSVTWSGWQFIAVGGSSSSGTVVTSSDGITWSSRTLPSTLTLRGVTWSGFELIAVGGGFVGSATVSYNGGSTWNTSPVDALTLYAVTAPHGFIVAVGAEGSIVTSPESVTWTKQTSGTTSNLWSIAWSGNQFAVVGDWGTILTSPDGVTWTSQFTLLGNWMGGVTWWDSKFITVGGGGVIWWSPDGVTWNFSSSTNIHDLWSVAGSSSRLVAVGVNGAIITSP